MLQRSLVIVLGSTGLTGNLCVRYLLEMTQYRVVMHGRNRSRLLELQKELLESSKERKEERSERLCILCASSQDLTNKESNQSKEFIDFLESGKTVVLNCMSSSEENLKIAKIVIECKCDWVDPHFDNYSQLKKMEGEIEKNGVCFVTQGGFHPGLVAVFVKKASENVKNMSEAIVSSYIRPKDGYPAKDTLWEVIHPIQNYKDFMKVWTEGEWKDSTSYDKKIQFEIDKNTETCYIFMMEEIQEISKTIPSLKECGFYVSGFGSFANIVITPLILLSRYINIIGKKQLIKLFSWSSKGLKEPYGVQLQVNAKNEDGFEYVYCLKVPDKENERGEYKITALPLVFCVDQILRKENCRRKPGLWFQGMLVDHTEMLSRLKNCKGIEISEKRIAKKKK